MNGIKYLSNLSQIIKLIVNGLAFLIYLFQYLLLDKLSNTSNLS